MDEINLVAFGELRQAVRTLTEEVKALRDQMDELVALANKGRGGLWTLVFLSGGAGGLVGWLAHWFNTPGVGK